jgi:Zinc carboxypeptidase
MHRLPIALLLSGLAFPLIPVAGTAQAKLYFDACPAFAEQYTFDCYHSYDEVTAFVRAAAEAYPDVARLTSMGQSWEGRDLWVMTITDRSTGDPESKPAIWVDGGIDSDEVVAVEVALGTIHTLLTSGDENVRELVRRQTFYVAPMVMPDATHRYYTTPVRPRDTTLRPWDDDNDGRLDEDGPDDLDGDQQALRMRRVDPSGQWVKDEKDDRIMRKRKPEDSGPFYTLYTEALDDDGDGRFAEDPFGGVDPNRNYPGDWSIEQGGAGPFPGSEPGLRAMLDFAVAHPNIAASQHFHSSGGVVLRPPSVPDMSLPAADEALYLEMSRMALKATGYDLATTVYDWNWPRGSTNRKRTQLWRTSEGEITGAGRSGDGFALSDTPSQAPDARRDAVGSTAYPAYGGSIDGMYILFGVLAFANEIYPLGEDLNGDGRRDEHEQLRFNDEVLGGYAFKDWTPFDHPQLGAVEIGGWRKFGQNNPHTSLLPREVERNVAMVLMQARHMPSLAVGEPELEDLGGGVFRVRVPVINQGFQPTELALRVQQRRAVPVRATLEGNGLEILSEDAIEDLGVLAGFGAGEARWVIRAVPGSVLRFRAWHPKAGRVAAEIRLTGAAPDS